jgi:hypothetical protein
MSTGDIAYQEQLPVPRRRGPAYGEVAAPPARAEPKKETEGPLDRRTEALLALAIVIPVTAAYAAIAYGVFLAADAIL